MHVAVTAASRESDGQAGCERPSFGLSVEAPADVHSCRVLPSRDGIGCSSQGTGNPKAARMYPVSHGGRLLVTLSVLRKVEASYGGAVLRR